MDGDTVALGGNGCRFPSGAVSGWQLGTKLGTGAGMAGSSKHHSMGCGGKAGEVRLVWVATSPPPGGSGRVRYLPLPLPPGLVCVVAVALARSDRLTALTDAAPLALALLARHAGTSNILSR